MKNFLKLMSVKVILEINVNEFLTLINEVFRTN